MKHKFKFLQTGGVPLTNDLMALLEEAYGIFEVLADLAGNLTILAGCDPVAPNSTTLKPGIVAIEGKLYYFEGGVQSSTVFINKEEIAKVFQDQTTKTLIEVRTVRFGNSVAPNLYNWADFVRLKTLKEMQNFATQQQIAELQMQIDRLNIKTAPIKNDGIVMIWPRTEEIPLYWKECTDLRGRTPIGYDPNYVYNATIHAFNYQLNVKGANIGELSVKMTGLQNGPHDHDVNGIGIELPNKKHTNSGSFQAFTVGNKKTTSSGNGNPHNNVQPSTVVMFIEPNFPF